MNRRKEENVNARSMMDDDDVSASTCAYLSEALAKHAQTTFLQIWSVEARHSNATSSVKERKRYLSATMIDRAFSALVPKTFLKNAPATVTPDSRI